MKKKIYDYFRKHPQSTHHDCAITLGISDLEALKLVHEMRKEGYLKVQVRRLGNQNDPNCSEFYSVHGEYPEVQTNE